MTNIMQGDQYAIPFRITYVDEATGETVNATPSIISNIEICVGHIKKYVPDVYFNNEKDIWEFPLTQEETFALAERTVKVQVRILLLTGDVIGKTVGTLSIASSISREVL